MAKYTLIKNVPKEKIINFIPTVLRRLVNIHDIEEDRVNLALFPPDKQKVTISGHTERLMGDVEGLKSLVVVGSHFTREAAQQIRENVKYFYSLDSTYWTDESYLRIKEFIRKKNFE